MNYKKIIKVIGVVGVAAVCCIGCGEESGNGGGDDDERYTREIPPYDGEGDDGELDDIEGEVGDDSYTYTGETVTIGSQTWMAKNLDRATNRSKCYGNSADSCAKYGRLYTWADSKRACPAGWHLPSDAEWTELAGAVGGTSKAGTKLKSREGWFEYIGVPAGTDDYVFSTLPGGLGTSAGYFSGIGNSTFLWTATGNDARSAIGRHMGFCTESLVRNAYSKTLLYSVRCVLD